MAKNELDRGFTQPTIRFKDMIRNCLVAAIFFALSMICVGQETDQYGRETWLSNYGLYREPVHLRLDRYSPEDVVKFRKKLEALLKTNESEWSGVFSGNGELSVSRVHWSPGIGYVKYGVYTCVPELQSVNYGAVTETEDYVEFSPEFAANSPRKAKAEKFIKVSWNGRKILVAESSLLAFAEKAAGIHLEPVDSNDEPDEHSFSWSRYWSKGDFETELVGLPRFPAAFKHFERSPISTRIASVGKRTRVKEYAAGNRFYTAPSALYRVVLNGGKNIGLRKGMTLIAAESEDEIFVERVGALTSNAVIVRTLDDDSKTDYCLNEDGDRIRCERLRAGLKATTLVGHMWY